MKDFTFWGERNRVAASVEKFRAKPGFEGFDPSAEGGLGDVALVGCLGEVSAFAQNQKVGQPIGVHLVFPSETLPNK